jgi:Na+/H+-dicarboxylate symporter
MNVSLVSQCLYMRLLYGNLCYIKLNALNFFRYLHNEIILEFSSLNKLAYRNY